ncbi:MAG: CDP-glycerol glycerophosphotransferase family protein [Candidatus Polarisedimenticolaceae bacterium]|nr:CDP-glycerol glycerophosphotransferase family protein [Candidatus Polarisedimenticolaceae bacterium]
MVKETLATSDIPVCYISSGEDDPGLLLEHPNYQTFKIDEGFVRNWLFENIDTDVMVMTMPDLHQYQVKRSKHKVHYVYVQHSLVSLHMAYRKGAFDHYDTIFCAGPHHLKEIRAMEAKYNLPAKNLLEHGYGRLDSIIEEAKKRPVKEKPDNAPKHVLIAPSWGPEGTIESGVGERIVDQLMEQGCQVTLRPHPQTIKYAKDKIETIINKHSSNPLFAYEANVAGQDSLHDSDIMISDWSGAALDYAFGLNKPVLFVDVPRKINNPAYEELGIEPFECFIRDKIGSVVRLGEAALSLKECCMDDGKYDLNANVFNYNNSSSIGANYISEVVNAN